MIGARTRAATTASLVLVLCVLGAWTAAAEQQPTFASNLSIEAGEQATLTVWNRPIVTLRAVIDGRTPSMRVSAIGRRISELPIDVLESEVTAT